jgi:hypothetical protein
MNASGGKPVRDAGGHSPPYAPRQLSATRRQPVLGRALTVEQLAVNPPGNPAADWCAVLAALAGM